MELVEILKRTLTWIEELWKEKNIEYKIW
jgi:hypothetical protein